MPPAETPTESDVLRRVLGRYLRGLRNQATLTTRVAARMLEWSEPKLWRVETGQTVLRGLDVEAMCRVYGAPADVAAALAGPGRRGLMGSGIPTVRLCPEISLSHRKRAVSLFEKRP